MVGSTACSVLLSFGECELSDVGAESTLPVSAKIRSSGTRRDSMLSDKFSWVSSAVTDSERYSLPRKFIIETENY